MITSYIAGTLPIGSRVLPYGKTDNYEIRYLNRLVSGKFHTSVHGIVRYTFSEPIDDIEGFDALEKDLRLL